MSATDPSPESKLKHADLEKFVVDTLSKREPCPAMVLAWGWLMKQVRRGVWPARRCCDVLTRARRRPPGRCAGEWRCAGAPSLSRALAPSPSPLRPSRALCRARAASSTATRTSSAFSCSRACRTRVSRRGAGARAAAPRQAWRGSRPPPPLPSPLRCSRAHLLRREDDGRGEHPRCAGICARGHALWPPPPPPPLFAPLFLSSALMPAGFIDLRKVQAVREGLKSIVLDGPKQGLMTKLFTRGAPPAPLSR